MDHLIEIYNFSCDVPYLARYCYRYINVDKLDFDFENLEIVTSPIAKVVLNGYVSVRVCIYFGWGGGGGGGGGGCVV
jgi:hypothetical protein